MGPIRAGLRGAQRARIPRERLATRVADAIAGGGVLVTAGAGYGKTTVLDQALEEAPGQVAWISCSDTERSPEVLLIRILDAIAQAVPGASDAVREGLAASPEQVDELAAARELLAELPRLLVDPLTLVIDDAEHLDGADRSLALISEVLQAEIGLLRIAVASRRALELRVAKPLAAGRLTALSAADLTFDAEECGALLRLQGERDPSPDEVEGLIEATEGWPLGVALTVARTDGGGGDGEPRDLRSAPGLRSFFSEELLDGLEPELREAAIESSVTRVVTPGVVDALGLPERFGERIERAGMLLRRADEGEGFTYHPLLRELLVERLDAERADDERRRLHAAVAPALAAAGDPIEAVEHWIAAERWPEAVAAIEEQGPILVRTSASLVQDWLSTLPTASRELPTMRSLQGQVAWGAGDHPRAVEALRGAVRGFGEHPNPPAEWLARFVLADSLFSIGEFEELGGVVDGWNDPEAAGAGVLAPATVVFVAVAFATIGRFEDSDRLAAEVRAHPDAALLGPVEALRLAFRDTPPGHLDRVLAELTAAERELQRSDPFNRRLYFVSTLAFMYAERGHTEEAIRIWKRVREGARGGGGPFLVDTTYAWCAQLHTQQGRLAEAEAELAHYEGREMGWQTCIGDLARASVASLRGDAAETMVCGERALEVVSKGPAVFIHRTVAELVPVFASVGRAGRAREMLEGTLVLVDEAFPRPRGRFLRGRLLALRAWLRHIEGDLEGADADLKLFWEEAGQTLPATVRREWVRLQPVVWSALERDVLEPAPTIDAIAHAFPEGLQLVAFLDHPVAAVQMAALGPAPASGDPEALAHLGRLAEDPDAELAAAASQAVERLVGTLPPLRFKLLGDFDAGRGSWRVGDAWGRPVDARLVRFLLVNLDGPVPEDRIFEALWPQLSVDKARSSLQVAASRARRVLDAPGAERSVIESFDRSYRMVLGDRDSVDAEEFRAAAEVALGEQGEQRGHLLRHARSLWGGEPMREDRYSDWATAYRERLVDSYTAVLAALVEIQERAGEHSDAVATARDLVDLDPLNEGGHRALIAAYARAGRTGHALRQYLECRRALVDGLGIEPAEATSRLQARVLAGESV